MSRAPHPAADLSRLFAPRGIAVVGASPDSGKLAGRPLAYLDRYGYAGAVHPVNPRHERIGAHRCVARPEDVPDPVDLALLLVPADRVEDALAACARRGIPFAISIAGGFAEAGAAERQAALARLCAEGGTRLVGPNCVGLLVPDGGVTATFSTVLGTRMPRPGGIALLTQSGALGNALLQSFNALDLGLRAWVSTGNEADLGVLDLLAFLVEDPDTHTIALFVEALAGGERLVPLVRRARAAGKVVVALRAGRSDRGRAASASHTGKLAGEARVWSDLARAAGLVEVASLEEMVDVLLARACFGHLPPAADGLGILTISGGLGVVMADQAAERGLPLPAFGAETRRRLSEYLPPAMAVANPVDTALFASEAGYGACGEAVLDDPGVGMLALVLTSLAHDYRALAPELARIAAAARAREKVAAVTFLAECDGVEPALGRELLSAGLLVLPTPSRLLAALSRWRGAVAALVDGPREPAPLPPGRGGDILRDAAVPLAASRLARTSAEAADAARAIGCPVVVKARAEDVAHKTEANAIRLGLATPAAAAAAFEELEAALVRVLGRRPNGLLVQEEVAGGLEAIVGLGRDAELGKVLMVGAGGIWTEILEDAVFLPVPASETEVEAAIGRLKAAPLFAGARGRPPLARGALAALASRLSRAFAAREDIAEVDLNPVIVRADDVVVVDALLVPAAPAPAPLAADEATLEEKVG